MKKFLMGLFIAAIAYGFWLTRYKHIGGHQFFDRWTQTIVSMPTKSDRAYQKARKEEAKRMQRQIDESNIRQWGTTEPEELQREWTRIYDSVSTLRDARYRTIRYEPERTDALSLLRAKQQDRKARDSIHQLWQSELFIAWGDFRKNHPTISQLQPPGFGDVSVSNQHLPGFAPK